MCTLLLATSVAAYHFTLSVVIFYVIFVISRLCYGHESINACKHKPNPIKRLIISSKTETVFNTNSMTLTGLGANI